MASREMINSDYNERSKEIAGWSERASKSQLDHSVEHSPMRLGSIEPMVVEKTLSERGVWVTTLERCVTLRDQIHSPNFLVMCLGDHYTDLNNHPDTPPIHEEIARQLTLRREYFAGDVSALKPIPDKVVRTMRRLLPVTPEWLDVARARIERFSSAFSALTGAKILTLNLLSERGPRRLELEDGGAPSAFHTDEAGVRIVAPLFGPQTFFLLPGGTPSKEMPVALPESRSAFSQIRPFDLDEAVEANYRRLITPLCLDTAQTLARAPTGSGILFFGAANSVARPLVHAGPQPSNGLEALSWGRLLITIDIRS